MPTILEMIQRREAMARQGLDLRQPTIPVTQAIQNQFRAALPQSFFHERAPGGGKGKKIGYAG